MTFKNAGVAQLVEYKLPKLGVAGSNPVARSIMLSSESGTQTTICGHHEDILRTVVYISAPLV
jgi:hypothetical protein